MGPNARLSGPQQREEEPAVSPAPTFADGMTAEDDRRFLELTNDLTHNAIAQGREHSERPTGAEG